MAKLGGCVNPFQVNLLLGGTALLRKERLSQGDETLFGAHDGTLHHEPVLIDVSITDEATHWGWALLSQILLGCAAGFETLLGAHAVDLF